METSYQNVDRPSTSRVSDPSVLKSKSLNKGGYLLIALGIITMIGSLVAAGCLYSQLGYTSFAIGGAGVILGILSFLLSKYCCVSTSSVSHSTPAQKTQETNTQLSKRQSRTSPDIRVNEIPARQDTSSTSQPDSTLSQLPTNKPQKIENKEPKPINSDTSSPLYPKGSELPLPPLLDLKLDPTSSLLKALPNDLFYHKPFGLAKMRDTGLLEIPLQFLISPNNDEYSFMSGVYSEVMSDPERVLQVTTLKNRIDALDQAIQLKERILRLKHPVRHLTLETILPAWPDGLLKFILMRDDELAQLTVSSIKPEEDNRPLWDVICGRVHALADKGNCIFLPNVNIANIQLIDLPKIKADQINSYPKLFPPITFLLIEFQEFTKIAIDKITNPKEVIEAIFGDTFKDQESEAAKRLASCKPETVYQLSPYIPIWIWKFLDQPLISQLDFSKVFTGMEEERKKEIVKAIFHNTHEYQESEAAKRLASCKPETIYQLSPYIPTWIWKFLDQPLISQLDFSKVFAGIDNERKKLIVEAIFHNTREYQQSEAAKRLAACKPETFEHLSPHIPMWIWKFLDRPLISQLDFSKVFAGIDDDRKKEIARAIFHNTNKDQKSEAAKRLRSMSKSQIKIIEPYLSSQIIKFIST